MRTTSQQINGTIWPFFLIGGTAGAVSLAENSIKNNSIILKYFNFANVDPDLLSNYIGILPEHVAPITLSLLLALVFLLSAFHRVVWGRVEAGNFFIKYFISPLEQFSTSLAVALLGVLLGLTAAALVSGSEIWVLCLATCFCPVAYLFLLHFAVNVNYVANAPVVNKMPPWIANRFDGAILLFFSIAILTFHSQLFAVIDWLSNLIEGLIR